MSGHVTAKIEKAIGRKNISLLLKMADTNDNKQKKAAIAGLGKIGGNDESSNFLISQLRHSDAHIRTAAAAALGEIGDVHFKAHISAQYDKETDPQVRDEMGKAMMNIKGY
jgi:HEAT repeat protein